MENKKINQFVLLPVPLESVQESGIDLSGVIETAAEDGILHIQNANTSNHICGQNCESCPFLEECDDDCGACPSRKYCEVGS